MQALKSKKRNLPEYISGFVDGEGCFSVSFSKRSKFLVGWETKPSFSVSQNYDRAEVLFLMKEYFDCGFMRRDLSDRTLKYEVRRLEDLLGKVIPHFSKYPLLSAKHNDFLNFQRVCELMKDGRHTTRKGLEEILPIAFSMNSTGRRKYSQNDILNYSSDEDIVSATSNSGII
jgi:hypothetical protein